MVVPCYDQEMKRTIILLFCSAVAGAQSIGVGVKVGAPMTDLFEAQGTIGQQAYKAHTQRLALGPMIEIRLPLGLGAEFDALYKRFDQTGGSITEGTVSKTGSSWEFPLLAKYRFGSAVAIPYVEGGVSFNRIGGKLAPFRWLPVRPVEQPEVTTTRTGVVVGAGLEVKLLVLRVAPGVRYTRWRADDLKGLPRGGSVDFLVGFVF